MNEEIINAMKLIDVDGEIIAESNIEYDVKVMNKIMLFMLNCVYNDVHKLVL